MTELPVGKYTGAEPLCVCIHVYIVNIFEMNFKHIVITDLMDRGAFLYTLRSDRRPMGNEP